MPHTPGPWRFEKSSQPLDGMLPIEGKHHVVAWVVNPTFGYQDNNGHLLAAAPELLRALKMAREYVEAATSSGLYGEDADVDLESIEAVIARAEGKS